MRLPRDRAGLTRLQLLVELQRGTHTKLAGLAERLGITVQAVSLHVADLQKAGLASAARGAYALTPRGLQVLQEDLAAMKGFVDLAWQRANAVEACSAVARTRVRAGQQVGLFMEEGLLVARAGRASPSKGTAEHDAAPGELVRVRGLEGLVALPRGKLVVLKVPQATGKATRPAAARLRRWARHDQWAPERIGAVGTEAQALALAAGLRPDFLFAPAHAAHHAAQLGLRVALLASPDQVRFVTAELDQLNEDAPEPVRYELRELEGRA